MDEGGISWKYILYPHVFDLTLSQVREMAEKLGYPFFFWDDVVYGTARATKTGFKPF